MQTAFSHTLTHNVQMIYSGTPHSISTYVEALTETFAPMYRIAGNFSRGPNFRNFRDPRQKHENKNHEISMAKI